MTRAADTALAAAALAPVVRPYLLVALEYLPDTLRVTSLPFNVTYLGDVYLGVGRLGAISEIAEGTEIRSYGLSLRMSGIPLDYRDQVIESDGQGRAGRVWLGLLDDQHRPIGVPLKVFQGRMDVTDIEIGQNIGVTISLESRLVDWERPRVRRFTDQDQKRAYPGDRGFEYVQAVSDMELVWGRG